MPPLVVLLVASGDEVHLAEETPERLLSCVGLEVVLEARIVAENSIAILTLESILFLLRSRALFECWSARLVQRFLKLRLLSHLRVSRGFS